MNISFYCPIGIDSFKYPWGFNDIEENGVGGAVQSVLLLAEKLVGMGVDVTVYQHTKKSRIERGIVFSPIAKAHKEVGKDTDVLVLWRSAEILLDFKKTERPKKVVCWLHDMIPQQELMPFVPLLDRIFVLSQFHANQYSQIARSKIVVMNYGVDLPAELTPSKERNKFHLVYTSNYDRGLELLLPIVHRLRAKFPELVLHVAYGFGTLDKLAPLEDLGAHQYKLWKESIESQLDMEHVVHHGQVSQQKIWQLLTSSDIFAYPCIYPETFCLSVAQAQIAGCIPVTINSGSLAEVCKWGWESEKSTESYEKTLEYVLTNRRKLEYERSLMLAHRVHPTWQEIANRWVEELIDSNG
jgi:glycosyltransferase involved in cell wall biosynthesis